MNELEIKYFTAIKGEASIDRRRKLFKKAPEIVIERFISDGAGLNTTLYLEAALEKSRRGKLQMFWITLLTSAIVAVFGWLLSTKIGAVK